MVHRPPRVNVGAGLLVLTAVAFTLTASAYAVMAVKRLHAAAAVAGEETNSRLVEFLDRHGAGLMGAELAVLAVAVLVVIGTERWQTGRGGVPAGTRPEQDDVPRETGVP